jgi:anaerobic C4-dicarboxylate transporter
MLNYNFSLLLGGLYGGIILGIWGGLHGIYLVPNHQMQHSMRPCTISLLLW